MAEAVCIRGSADPLGLHDKRYFAVMMEPCPVLSPSEAGMKSNIGTYEDIIRVK